MTGATELTEAGQICSPGIVRSTAGLARIAVLFAREDSVYKTLPECDVYDMARDARTYDGPWPVVAHPPCRGWATLRHCAKPRADERNLARLAVAMVREFGGVLEHPHRTTLWEAQRLPAVGQRDAFGGFTLVIDQNWWGHRAQKRTRLYVVGCEPAKVPPLPLVLGEATHTVGLWSGRNKATCRPSIAKHEYENTPDDLASWLVELARRCHVRANVELSGRRRLAGGCPLERRVGLVNVATDLRRQQDPAGRTLGRGRGSGAQRVNLWGCLGLAQCAWSCERQGRDDKAVPQRLKACEQTSHSWPSPTFELSRPWRQAAPGRGRTIYTMAWSGQATPAGAGRLE